MEGVNTTNLFKKLKLASILKVTAIYNMHTNQIRSLLHPVSSLLLSLIFRKLVLTDNVRNRTRKKVEMKFAMDHNIVVPFLHLKNAGLRVNSNLHARKSEENINSTLDR